MKRIAICDNRHFEVTHTIISLFDNATTDITIFIHPGAYDQLRFLLGERAGHFTWVIKGEEENNRSFISRMFNEIRKHPFDIIYFVTIADNFIVYAYHLKSVKRARLILTLHDINGSFRYRPSPGIRRIVRYAGKRMLLAIFPTFVVLSEGLSAYLQKRLRNRREVLTIPGSFFSPGLFIKKEYREGEIIKITVPGSVDSRRRNYDAVFELLDMAARSNISISITLLGSFSARYGNQVLQDCLDYSRSNNNLHFYREDTVPQPEFDVIMAESHFVWTPLQPVVIINDGIKEEYGTSICSGNIGDIIRHAKPFFAPSHLSPDSALRDSCHPYEQVSEIIKVLLHLNIFAYNQMQEKAINGSLYYTKEKIAQRNSALFT